MNKIKQIQDTLQEVAIVFHLDRDSGREGKCIRAILDLAIHKQEVAELVDALRELDALVRGECPSLLNEDSGGNGRLALEIEKALSKFTEAK